MLFLFACVDSYCLGAHVLMDNADTVTICTHSYMIKVD